MGQDDPRNPRNKRGSETGGRRTSTGGSNGVLFASGLALTSTFPGSQATPVGWSPAPYGNYTQTATDTGRNFPSVSYTGVSPPATTGPTATYLSPTTTVGYYTEDGSYQETTVSTLRDADGYDDNGNPYWTTITGRTADTHPASSHTSAPAPPTAGTIGTLIGGSASLVLIGVGAGYCMFWRPTRKSCNANTDQMIALEAYNRQTSREADEGWVGYGFELPDGDSSPPTYPPPVHTAPSISGLSRASSAGSSRPLIQGATQVRDKGPTSSSSKTHKHKGKK